MPCIRTAALSFLDAVTYGRPGSIAELVTTGFVDHAGTRGATETIELARFLSESLGVTYEVHELVEVDERVAIYVTVTAPSGCFPNVHVFATHNGWLAERWTVVDELGVLVPVPADASTLTSGRPARDPLD